MIIPELSKHCCVTGETKLIGRTLSLAAGASGEVVFDKFPGRFCVHHVFISGAEVISFQILSFKVGIKDVIMSGEVNASMFATTAECCPPLCIDCVCTPGVNIVIRFRNDDSTTQAINVTLLGCYEEVCK